MKLNNMRDIYKSSIITTTLILLGIPFVIDIVIVNKVFLKLFSLSLGSSILGSYIAKNLEKWKIKL